MLKAVPVLLQPPKCSDYLRSQELRLLHSMLVWSFGVAVVGALVNVALHDRRGMMILVVLAAICLVGVILSHWERPAIAGLLLCFAILTAVTAEAFYGGGIRRGGLHR